MKEHDEFETMEEFDDYEQGQIDYADYLYEDMKENKFLNGVGHYDKEE